MAEISSDNTRFRSAYVALWELLSSGISKEPWFWYGEAVLYGNGGAEEWRPLLLRRIRQPEGTVEVPDSDFASPLKFVMPDFYAHFYNATKDEDVLSVLHAVHAQFGRQQSDLAPIPVFAALNSNDTASDYLRDRLVERAGKMEKLAVSRYHVFLSSETLKAMNEESAQSTERSPKWVTEYTNYVKRVMNADFTLPDSKVGKLYPENAWLFALPIYTIQRGRPLLLAIFIIIAEGHDFVLNGEAADKSLQEHLQKIEALFVQLEVQATHILSHRFFREIDGYVPGSDPIVLLAHPSLAKAANITELRMEGILHDNDVKFREACSDPDSIYRRAIERTCETPARLMKIPSNILQELTPTEKRRWLKALYGHKRAHAHIPYEPGSHKDYRYNSRQLSRLACLLALLEPTDSSIKISPSVSVYIYPRDKNADDNNTFHWAVEPGVRFLIPWLKAVRGIAQKVGCGSTKILIIPGSSSHWDEFRKVESLDFRNGNALESRVMEKWADLRKKDEHRPNGLVVSFDCTGGSETEISLQQRVQGWTRALIDPYGRRGDDTALIQNLLLGNIGDVLTDEGLSFPGSDPLFLPLVGSLSVKVDFMAAGFELLMAVTW